MPESTQVQVETNTIVHSPGIMLGEPVVMKSYGVKVGRHYPPHTSLSDLKDLSKTREVTMSVNIEGQLYEVQLPKDMMVRLTKYLSDKNYPFDKNNFDCVDFVHWMISEPHEGEIGVNLEKFDMERLYTESNLKPGDVIHMSASNKYVESSNSEHAMIYIGHGLYLSKSGVDNGLSVQSLIQLQEVYKNNKLFRQVRKAGNQQARSY
jgi:hypothetical protein